MATVAYYCDICKKEFTEWYKSLKECLDRKECPDCKKECYSIIGTPQIHYKNPDTPHSNKGF